MKAAVASPWSTTQWRYKRDFDKNVQRESTVKIGVYVFVDHPWLIPIASDAANEIASRRNNKLQHKHLYYVEYSNSNGIE